MLDDAVVAIRTFQPTQKITIKAGSVGFITKIREDGNFNVDFGVGYDVADLKMGVDIATIKEFPDTIDLDEEDLKELHDRIDNEGFDYCFLCYSEFGHIADAQFHKLRKEYKKIRETFEKYLKYGRYAE